MARKSRMRAIRYNTGKLYQHGCAGTRADGFPLFVKESDPALVFYGGACKPFSGRRRNFGFIVAYISLSNSPYAKRPEGSRAIRLFFNPSFGTARNIT